MTGVDLNGVCHGIANASVLLHKINVIFTDAMQPTVATPHTQRLMHQHLHRLAKLFEKHILFEFEQIMMIETLYNTKLVYTYAYFVYVLLGDVKLCH